MDRQLINPESALADVLRDIQRRLRTVERRTSWPSPTFLPTPVASGTIPVSTSPTWVPIVTTTQINAGRWLFLAQANVRIDFADTTLGRPRIRITTTSTAGTSSQGTLLTLYGVSGNVISNTVSTFLLATATTPTVAGDVITAPDTLDVTVEVAANTISGNGTGSWSNPYVVGIPL